MSVTMTAPARGTPTLDVAPTQNTAPVHEFRCMFSHDLRKKKKTWHDGSVRFHTFNKRVMVYDESKNFIGDLHYRVTDEFGEGTELQLDRGILVQVEDRIGRTDTDLAPLLDKRRADEDSHGPHSDQRLPMHPPLLRTGPAYSQSRPRSLADVLGASQGPLGRARLPNRSPYEQSHNLFTMPATNEPPAKRLRLDTDREDESEIEEPGPGIEKVKENHRKDDKEKRARAEKPPRIEKVKEKRRKDDKAVRRSPLVEMTKNLNPREVVESTSDDKPVGSKPAPARPEAGSTTKATSKKDRDSTTVSKSAVRQSNPKKSRPWEPKGLSTPTTASVRSNSSLSNVGPWIRRSVPGKTQLRFSTDKPPPKLMYRALLPVSEQRSKVVTPPTTKEGQGNTDRENISPKPRADSPSDPFNFDDVGDFEIESVEPQANCLNTTPLRTGLQSASAQSSPLFCPPSSHERRNEEPQILSQNDMLIPSSMDDNTMVSPQYIERSPIPDTTGMAMTSSMDDNVILSSQPCEKSPMWDTTAMHEDDPVEKERPTFTKPPIPDKLTLLDRRLMMPPPMRVETLPERLQESPRPRPFRRVLSENDSPTKNFVEHEPNGNIPTALQSLKAKQSLASNARGKLPFKSPTKLQRSVSDMSGLTSVTKNATIANETEVIPEVGPWTSMEAFLLFDWWPPGHEKPRYGQTGEREIETLGSRRRILRDEAHVL